MADISGLLDFSNYYYNPYALPFLLAAVLTLFVGGYVFLHSGRRLRAVFSMLCGLIFIWLFTTVPVYCSRYPGEAEFYIRLMYFGISFIAPSLCLYVSVWLDQWEANRVKIILGYVLAVTFFFAILLTHTIVSGVSKFFWGFHSRFTPLGTAFFIPFFFGYVVLFFQTLYRGYRAERDVSLKKQVWLVTVAFIIAFFATMDFFPCFGVPIFPTGGLLLFFAFCVLSYTIIRYKLFDIETVIHKTLMWLLTTIVAIVPFAALVYWTQRLRDPSSAWGSTVYYLAIAIAFYFYFRSIQPRLDHLFQRQRRNLMAIMTKFSQELVHLKNLRDLLQSFARMLRRQLYVRRLSVFLLDEKTGEYMPAIAKGLRNLKPFRQDHPFLVWLARKDAVVMGNLVGADPEVEAFKNEIDQFFHATQGMVAVPLVLGGKMIGVVSLGRKANLKSYRPMEVQFLTQLKIPVTIAFSNSMQFENISELYTQVRGMSEELKRWNVELERRVEDRTRELVKTQDQLVQAEKLATLGTLAGGVAHEINNPLTAVLTNAQILKMTADKDAKESLDLIEEGAKRCQGIVQKLMKYARKTEEETPHKPVDLNDVVKGTLALLGFQFQQENIEVETKLGEVSPFKGITGELEQVLTNLLVNARDAVQAAKVKGRIIVETRQTQDAIELAVTDNGIGIPKENQKKIFDPFFTTKDVGSGTGLGLAVSFGILKRHNATIKVDSAPGQGAVFTLNFPVA